MENEAVSPYPEVKTFLLLLLAVKLNCKTLVLCTPQMSFHVIYKAPCGLCLRNMAEIQHYLFQTRCDFIFLEMFCLDPYVLVDRPFQPQRPFYYIHDITGGKEDIPLSCVNEIDSTPPPKVAYSKNHREKATTERLISVHSIFCTGNAVNSSDYIQKSLN